MDLALPVLLATFAALFVSSCAGYGGSLVLVPALSFILGPKEGIALAALLLGWNNVFKMIAYRKTIPWREGWPLLLVTFFGVWLGATLLIAAPERLVWGAIITVTVLSLLTELAGNRFGKAKRASAVPTMAASAVFSGVSGTSGPLKGLAIRYMGWPRLHHVGMASAVSFIGDAWKAELFANAGLLPTIALPVLLCSIPMMPVAAWAGLQFNRRVGENTFRWVFWGVVGGYTLRMVGLWV